MVLHWCLLLLLCPIVFSQPNNLCEDAVSFTSVPFTYSGSTVGSSRESSCSTYSNYAGDVWFRYNPSVSVRTRVNLCTVSYDSRVYIISGTSCSSYSCLASNDDGCGIAAGSQLDYIFLAGTQYFIVVSGYSGNTGTYTLSLTYLGAVGPTSGCTAAQYISALPFTISDSITSSALAYPCRGTFDYYADWYSFTPTFTVTVVISLCSAASYDTYLSIATGPCPSVTCTGIADDDSCQLQRSIITTTFTANIQYFIIVTSSGTTVTGTYALSVTGSPPNDLCAAANVITSLPFTVIASTESGTQDYSCNSGSVVSGKPDVWFSFTPTSNYPAIVLSTCASSSRQTIYLARGICGSLQCIQSDSSSCPYGGTTSGYILTSMQAGTTYYMAVAGTSAPSPYQLDVFIPPVNDLCSGAIQISNLPYTAPATSTTYARPDYTCNTRRNRDIFYTFTPVLTYDSTTITLCGSSFDTFLMLATGSCASLSTCIASNDDDSSCGISSILTGLTLTAGTTYYIVVSGFFDYEFGSVSLSITGTPRVVGCGSARAIPSIPYSFSAFT